MQDVARGVWVRPSRLAGWGLVALVHLLIWQVLSRGLDVFHLNPVLQSVQVKMFELEPPPPVAPPPPQAPIVQVAITDLYVPAPEVDVVRESSSPVTASSIMPPDTSESSPLAADTPSQSSSVLVVSDSEVDYVVRPQIRYPLAAKRAREHGTVLLSVIVDEQGLVRRIKVHRSSGYPRLDEVALHSLRSLRVKPYKRNGMPLAVEIRVPVEFSLSNAA